MRRQKSAIADGKVKKIIGWEGGPSHHPGGIRGKWEELPISQCCTGEDVRQSYTHRRRKED